MERFLALFLTAGLALLPAQDSKPGPKHVNADELKQLMDKEKGKFFFLDVREPAEIEEMGSVAGYVNIPVGQLEKRLSEIPKEKPVIVACRSGRRAETARQLLEKNGYQVIASCGLLEWKQKDYPLVKPEKK
ncbi:MAG: rhodanese-like domain-containing protein [Bryobacteraceae bacterium]|nr:rhodanese-like domain-containing protein [Bryobacteraceae bacterium]